MILLYWPHAKLLCRKRIVLARPPSRHAITIKNSASETQKMRPAIRAMQRQELSMRDCSVLNKGGEFDRRERNCVSIAPITGDGDSDRYVT
jgi:hypothetical protein